MQDNITMLSIPRGKLSDQETGMFKYCFLIQKTTNTIHTSFRETMARQRPLVGDQF